MKRLVWITACLLLTAASVPAATLERLSLDEMIEKATAIVRGRIDSSQASFHGPIIYTHFSVQVLERWKGEDVARVDVVVPGGTAKGLHQTFAGTPQLLPGSEYVLFLWKGSSGLTHVIGLSQGVFTLKSDGKGGMLATRSASTEAMLDRQTGQVVSDETLQLRVGDLRSRVSAATARSR
jgi:hypothetical protein